MRTAIHYRKYVEENNIKKIQFLKKIMRLFIKKSDFVYLGEKIDISGNGDVTND